MNSKEIKHLRKVAETILQQIRASIPADVFFSWGISSLSCLSFRNMPSLQLVVNGFKHKGVVIIALNEMSDYYDIYFSEKGTYKIVAQDIDCESLGSTIDRLVETGDDEAVYAAFVEQQRQKLLRGDF